MFLNYIKTALRNLKREKTYSVINIFGLSIGLTCFVLFYFSWQYENSFDKFNNNAENIYQLSGKASWAGKMSDIQFFNCDVAANLMADIPEVQAAADINFEENVSIRIGSNQFKNDICLANENIFKIFTIPILKSQSINPLSNPQAVLLSESMAKKCFGNENPLGKTIVSRSHRWEGDEEFHVMGITKDLPSTSSYKMDIICSSEKYDNRSAQIFIRLREGTSLKDGGNKVVDYMKSKYSKDDILKIEFKSFELKQLINMHISDPAITKYLFIFGIVAFVVLLLSCINYINLSIGISIKRIKEIGVRKTLGSGRINLIIQYLSESFITILLALTLSIVIIYLLASVIPASIIRPIKISDINVFHLAAGLIGVIVSVTLISGAYPAFYISRLNPSTIFTGAGFRGRKRFALKKGLIFVQFTVLIILMVLTTGISSQLGFIENKGLGFDKENIVLINALDISILNDTRMEDFRTKMTANPHIKSVSYMAGHPAHFSTQRQVSVPGIIDGDRWSEAMADKGFLTTFSIPLLEGRNFEITDNLRAKPRNVLINESAARLLGSGSAVGKTYFVISPFGNKKEPVRVIGVFKNFTQKTLHYGVNPMTISQLPGFGNITAIKIDGKNVKESLDYIKETWKSFFPSVDASYTFFDEKIQSLYLSEYRLGAMSKIFTALSIIIAIMGIFGITAFSTEQRKKEIAIRKVLGASLNRLVVTFFKEINMPAVIANAVSLPIGIYLLNKWLEEFAFKVSIPFTDYLLVVVTSLLLALITVSAQVFRVARTNPVNSLRSE